MVYRDPIFRRANILLNKRTHNQFLLGPDGIRRGTYIV